MHAEFPRFSQVQLDELRGDLPMFLRQVLTINEGLEAAPCTRSDASVSVESLLKASPEGRALLENGFFNFKSPYEQLGILVASLHVLAEHLETLSSDDQQALSPRELIFKLHDAQAGAEVHSSYSSDELEGYVAEVADRYNELKHGYLNLESQAFASPAEVQLGEAQILSGMEPGNPDHHFRTGDALFSLGRLQEGLVELRKAREIKPDEPTYNYFLAKCLFDLGEPDEAKGYALQAAKLFPSNPACWQLLGEVHEALGEKQLAVNAFLKAAKAGMGSKADVALQRLSAIEALEMPRPANFRLPDIDERVSLSSRGVENSFRIRVFRGPDKAVVVGTQDDLTGHPSITNLTEHVATEVRQLYNIPHDEFVWIEHYEDNGLSRGNTLSRVEFELDGAERYCKPRWSPMPHKDFEKLTGFRLTWGKP